MPLLHGKTESRGRWAGRNLSGPRALACALLARPLLVVSRKHVVARRKLYT